MKKRFLTLAVSAVILLAFGCLLVSAETTQAQDGDLLIAEAGDVTVADTVTGDVLGVAYSMTVEGHVQGSIRAAAIEMVLKGGVERNVTVAAMVLQTAEELVAEDVYIFASEAQIYGTFESLTVYGSTVIIGGTVTGELVCEADTVIILEGASFGSARIVSQNEPVVAKDATLKEFSYLSESAYAETVTFEKETSDLIIELQSLLFTIPASVLLALCLAFLTKKISGKVSVELNRKPFAFLLKGFGWLIALPLAALFLCASYVTIYVGGVLALVAVLLFAISKAFAAVILGRLWMSGQSSYVSASVFAAAITVLSVVPYLGGVISFCCMLVTFGALQSLVFDRRKQETQAESEMNFTL